MARLAPFLCVLLIVSFTAAQIYDDLPGTNDDDKIQNIRRAVSQVRQYAAGQACWTQHFPSPADADAIERWTQWICSFLGGPVSVNPNCTWRTQPDDNTTVITEPVDLVLELSFKHNSLTSISQTQSELFTQLLANALTNTDTTTVSADDIVEAFANVTRDLVNPSVSGCPTPDVTIQWAVPGRHDDSVVLNGLVSWVWADTLEHSVAINTGESALLVGFGSNALTLTRTTACQRGAAAFPDGGTPCNMQAGTGNFTYSQYFVADDTIDYHCAVHALLNGTLTVGAGSGTGGNTNTNTAPVDVDDQASDDGNDGGDGAGMKLASWLRF